MLLVTDQLREWQPRRRTAVEIQERLGELRMAMAARPASDPMTELVAEHRDLVRERNSLLNERTR